MCDMLVVSEIIRICLLWNSCTVEDISQINIEIKLNK